MDKRKRRQLVGRVITVVVLGAVAIMIGLGFVPKPVPVNVGKVERRALEVTVDETGKTRLRDKFVVSAPVTGHLSRIALQVGDLVTEGAVVGSIAPLVPQLLDERTRAEAAARVEVAEAHLTRTRAVISRAGSAVNYAKSQAERNRKLRGQGGVSEQQYEQSEYQLRSAEEELASARLAERVSANELAAARTALTSINGVRRGEDAAFNVIAPAGGRVLRVHQESEGAVQAGAALLELGDPRKLEIVVDVLTTDAVPIAVGAVATIERWGGDYPLAARVQRKEPSAFTTRSALGVEEQRVPVVLDIVEDETRRVGLDDGYRVEARIRVKNVDDALVVPASALFREAGAWAAFVMRNAQAQKVNVQVGVRNPDWAQVERGLALGDSVILYPSDQVVDGAKVIAQ